MKRMILWGLCLAFILFALSGCDQKNQAPTVSDLGSGLASQMSEGQGYFTGVWKRTGVKEKESATITIEDETKTNFSFSVDTRNGASNGSTMGVAHLSSALEASCTYNDYGGATVTFTLANTKDLLTVKVTNHAALGFGSGVTMDGVYTKGQPSYTDTMNASEIEQTAEQSMKRLLGTEAYTFLCDVRHDGSLEETRTTTGVKGKLERYTVRAAGLGADILTGENGHFYIGLLGYEDQYVFYTDDSAYRDKLPTDFDWQINGEVEMYFRGK